MTLSILPCAYLLFMYVPEVSPWPANSAPELHLMWEMGSVWVAGLTHAILKVVCR